MIDDNKLATDVIASVTEDAIKAVWKKISRFFKDISVKDSIRYGNAYAEYLENTRNNYSKVKTIIYNHVPTSIYSFYECIDVLYNDTTIGTSSINILLSVSNKIIVTGTGGAGKSMLFKYLYLNSIEETDLIPVLFTLRNFNMVDTTEISLEKEVYNNLVQNGFSLEEKYFEYSMREGGYVILLDGLDEVNRDKLDKVIFSIKELCNKYPHNKYIISSRPTDSFIGWNDFAEMNAKPLTKQQALNLISKIDYDKSIKDIFYKGLDNSLFDKYESFASNPLLLNIMLLTFNKHASIPDKLNDFYEQAFLTLFNMHDATKEAYVRDIRSGLGCEDFKAVFSYICFKSYFNDEYSFTESSLRDHIQHSKQKFENLNFTVNDYKEDLTLSVCMLIKDGLDYAFTHRSFQEYFAALYTCKLPDKIQSELLTRWLEESNASISEAYISMLFDMQSDRFNINVLIPGIRQIKHMYEKYGESIAFYNIFISGVFFRSDYKLPSWTINDRYLLNILLLSSKFNNDIYDNEILDKKTIEIISNLNNVHGVDFSLNEICNYIGEKDTLIMLHWLRHKVEFALDLLERYNKVKVKHTLSDILEDL